MKNALTTCTLAGALLLSGTSLSLADKEYTTKGRVKALLDTEKITGSDLWDFHGNKIGDINRVLLAPSGQRAYLVVDADDFLEENRKVMIPWRNVVVKMKSDSDGDDREMTYSLDVDKTRLKSAPVFDENFINMEFDRERTRTFESFWNDGKEAAEDAAEKAEERAEDAAEAAEAAEERAEKVAEAAEERAENTVTIERE